MEKMMACKGVGCWILECTNRKPHLENRMHPDGNKHYCSFMCIGGNKCEPVEVPMSVKERVIELAKMLESGEPLDLRSACGTLWLPIAEFNDFISSLYFGEKRDIRIRPEPVMRPWNGIEMRGKWVRNKGTKTEWQITDIRCDAVYHNGSLFSGEELLRDFDDVTDPNKIGVCGVEVKT